MGNGGRRAAASRDDSRAFVKSMSESADYIN